MSSLRQPTHIDLLQPTHIEQDYKALVEICKTDCQITYRKSAMDTVQLCQMDTGHETERVRQMIGTKDEFSAKMSADPMYQQMVALILRLRQRVKRKLIFE
tara:strand:+ start:185 stop:487 length:303 start_codon:yes stop_codon:yes gene_type:complete